MVQENDYRPADPRSIDTTRYNDVRYWARVFHCTPDQLRAAVKAAGTSATAVDAYLSTAR